MARFIIKPDTATKLCDLRRGRSNGLFLRVISAGTIFISRDRNVLEFADISGTPQGGLPVSNLDPPFVLPLFDDVLWARAGGGANMEIEFDVFSRGG